MAVASIIEGVQTYMKTFEPVGAAALVSIDKVGNEPPQFAVVTLPGSRKIEEYIVGGSLSEFLFAFHAQFSTADDATRLENSGLFEALAAWLDTQTEAETFPEMPAGMTPETIEAVSSGFLYQEGESDTGIYQITCRLEYSQE